MNRILLDTSAYSAFMRGDESIVEALRSADEIAFTPVILGELKVLTTDAHFAKIPHILLA